MKLTSFLWLCIAFYSLWLLRGINNHGILHKEREAMEQTLIKGQGLIDQLQLTAVDADKVVKDVQADYQVKTKSLPKILESVYYLITTLHYAVIILLALATIACITYVIKS